MFPGRFLATVSFNVPLFVSWYNYIDLCLYYVVLILALMVLRYRPLFFSIYTGNSRLITLIVNAVDLTLLKI